MSLNRDCTVQASEAACSCAQPKNDFRLKSLELNLLLTANIFESGPMHSAAACIYGKIFFLDFMLIFEKFRLFYDLGTHF